MKIGFTGGGTGGHAVPIVSIYKHLGNEKYEFVWFGGKDSIEEKLAKENEIKFIKIASGKLRRYFDWKNFYEPFYNIWGIFQSLYFLKKEKIDLIFSKGGFVSVPTCIAAFILRIPVFLHESDKELGLANKIVSKFSKKIFYTFENLKIDGKRFILSGPIISNDLQKGFSETEKIVSDKKNIFVIAGSQGSKKIFTEVLYLAKYFTEINFTIGLGTKNLDFKEKFREFKNVKTYDFLNSYEIGKILKNTDLVITRASSMIWEIKYFSIQMIIIPLKIDSGQQMKNAIYFKEKFNINFLDEEKNFSEDLKDSLEKFLNGKMEKQNFGNNLDGLEIIEKSL